MNLNYINHLKKQNILDLLLIATFNNQLVLLKTNNSLSFSRYESENIEIKNNFIVAYNNYPSLFGNRGIIEDINVQEEFISNCNGKEFALLISDIIANRLVSHRLQWLINNSFFYYKQWKNNKNHYKQSAYWHLFEDKPNVTPKYRTGLYFVSSNLTIKIGSKINSGIIGKSRLEIKKIVSVPIDEVTKTKDFFSNNKTMDMVVQLIQGKDQCNHILGESSVYSNKILGKFNY